MSTVITEYVLGLSEIDDTKLALVGGKALNLGELSRIEGVQVPEGFCVTTEAYRSAVEQGEEFGTLLDRLASLKADDRERIGEVSEMIRGSIEGFKIAEEIEEQVDRYLARLGEDGSYAVRSSATAEDLPLASFAGQQDTYLNVKGRDAILRHVSRCWASLFTDRAVTYRIQNGFDHRKVRLAVVVQRMVLPQVSGVMFTADPVTSNRKVLSIDASFGLGEALVAGLVNPDTYRVRDGVIVDRRISTKMLAVHAREGGGTEQREVEPDRQNAQTLTDEQILDLERAGRLIESHFGCPQDIEWCFAGEALYILQSRPITTLFPIPEVRAGENRVFMSVGHIQMMTEDVKPLGMSFFGLLSYWFGPSTPAGGRLFSDVTHDLNSRVGRNLLLNTSKVDLLMHSAISDLMSRKDYVKSLPRGKNSFNIERGFILWALQGIRTYLRNDVAIMERLIARNEALTRDVERRIAKVDGEALFDFIVQDTKQLKAVLFDPTSMGIMMAGGYALDWLNKNMEKWLGEKGAAETLSKSVPNNITSEMGLELLNVSDVVRRHPAVVEYLDHATDETFFEGLAGVEGGDAVGEAMRAYLDRFGMRCPGEIDITKPRWTEKPAALIPLILGNIRNFAPGSGADRYEQGRLEAEQKALELLRRLEQLPGGEKKARKTKKMISVLRNFIGYREFPKYFFIKRFQLYKNALMKEAAQLVEKGVIREKEDVYYLSLEEFREAVRTNGLDYSLITERRAAYELFEKLSPPRLMTSEGEVIRGEYRDGDIPQGALAGTPVSSGVVEGRARVVLKMEDASIEDGDILVTAFTDPGWTPLFVSVKGLVTEIGGLMSHGAVITREYGLPAVVGVENATKLIRDGQRIRVNGTAGYVELL